ncbi:hypothetical protein CA85_14580 [Allorhodopirellula solitaria]|uniref:Uncharacterized protein n=1 Tax=Allorhodopirellula solitaria TaxID=2527987 RepID=A0A5C5YBC3_9BACT|nr:hypothetical protein CA85_14580 [Allorhodopirellula solitaria]
MATLCQNEVIIAGCGGDKLIRGGVIAGWTFGSLGGTESAVAGSRESYRRLAWLEYEGSEFLGQGNSRTSFWRKQVACSCRSARTSRTEANIDARENRVKLLKSTPFLLESVLSGICKCFGPSGFVVGNSSVLDFRGMAVASEMSDAVTE